MSSMTTQEYLNMLRQVREGRTKRVLDQGQDYSGLATNLAGLTGLRLNDPDEPVMDPVVKSLQEQLAKGSQISSIVPNIQNPDFQDIRFSNGERITVPKSLLDEASQQRTVTRTMRTPEPMGLSGQFLEREVVGSREEMDQKQQEMKDLVFGIDPELVELMDKSPKEATFQPHTMYDPQTGRGILADTYQKHLALDRSGYTHTKPQQPARIDPGLQNLLSATPEQVMSRQSGDVQINTTGSEAFQRPVTERRDFEFPTMAPQREVIRDGNYAYVVERFPDGRLIPLQIQDAEGNVVVSGSGLNDKMKENILGAYNRQRGVAPQQRSMADFPDIPKSTYEEPLEPKPLQRTPSIFDGQKPSSLSEYGDLFNKGGVYMDGETSPDFIPYEGMTSKFTLEDISEDLAEKEPGKLKEFGKKAVDKYKAMPTETKAMLGLFGLEAAAEVANYLGPARREGRERLQELEERRDRGMLGVDERQDAETMKYMTRPIRALAEETEREQQAVMAGMGETRSAADLRRLRDSRDAQMTDALSRSGQEIARQQMARKEMEKREMNQLQAYQQANLRNLTNRITGTAAEMAKEYSKNVAAQAKIQDEVSPDKIQQMKEMFIAQGMSEEEALKKAREYVMGQAEQGITQFLTGEKS
tara:strand:+ start:3607 stop:5535 length:1929 start_codon:yes stop_codon:yes gene_type:complete